MHITVVYGSFELQQSGWLRLSSSDWKQEAAAAAASQLRLTTCFTIYVSDQTHGKLISTLPCCYVQRA
jgi:hypothetical protein